MKFEEIWPRGFRGEVVQRCERTDGWMDDGQGVITIAHPETLAKVSQKKRVCLFLMLMPCIKFQAPSISHTLVSQKPKSGNKQTDRQGQTNIHPCPLPKVFMVGGMIKKKKN